MIVNEERGTKKTTSSFFNLKNVFFSIKKNFFENNRFVLQKKAQSFFKTLKRNDPSLFNFIRFLRNLFY